MYIIRFTGSDVRTLRLDLEKENSKWEMLATLEGHRMDTSITSDGESFIYLSGGSRLVDIRTNPMLGSVPLTSVARYDMAKDTWENNWANMPTPRYSHSSIVANNKLYILGGRNEEHDLPGPSMQLDPTQQVPICNLKTKVWSYGSPMPGQSADSIVFLWEKNYLITFPLTSKCTLVFDTSRDKWNLSQKVFHCPPPVDQKCCLLPNGRVALLGGLHAFKDPPNWTDKVIAIDVDEIIKTKIGG